MTIDRPPVLPATYRYRSNALAYLAAIRPKQWTKNAIVFAALVFDLKLFDLDRLLTVIGAFVCFCLASSAVYVVNDLHDVESDRLHPKKRHRPIASGQISRQSAWLLVALLLLICIPLALALRPEFGAVLLGYLALMTAYTFVLKHLVIVDVFAISAGFVLRAAGGAVVLDIPISPWLYVCTVLLSLFIGFGKRRHELLLLEVKAGSHRRNLEEYSPELLDQFITISAAATIMAYSLYTFEADTLPDDRSMMLTIPFVLYAIMRYLFLVHRRDGGGSPEQILLSDMPLLGCITLWGIVAVAILYLG
ncbi:MAG TPA: decaprenyl-phosphate phosphoribosyltransferase [Thermomicrobiales bacterium]|nr:decaprenyl-phosphate phosphoribosyltransferase [Thermomicrobiales bacterium]